MPALKKSKKVHVKSHERVVPISNKNPTGITIVDEHFRQIDNLTLDSEDIYKVFQDYDKKNITYPSKGKLKIKNSDNFDEIIAVWVDYFNQSLKLKSQIDPDMVKALIASESTFQSDAKNKNATGLTQITLDTLKILKDQKGDDQDFTFKNINKSDLKDPMISIALGVRWIAYKKKYADNILKRNATPDETIQVYKGILNDQSKTATLIMKKYRDYYDQLKKK